MSEGRFRRAYLGLALGSRPLPPRIASRLGRRDCVEIVSVVESSPAARAGLRPEDLIVAVDGRPIENVDELQRQMVGELIGAEVRLILERGGRELELTLVPDELEA
jgi:S1-C subfamily serine protease